MRDGKRAAEVYKSFCPPYRGLNPELYYTEPYVTPGNVDGPDSPCFGRGGLSWYTGSAAWYAVVVLNWILGIRPRRDGLLIDPVIPQDWPGFKVKRLFRGSVYRIEVKNAGGKGQGVKEIRVDGKKLEAPVIPAFRDGKEHHVQVIL